jgi:hypothetical protein
MRQDGGMPADTWAALTSLAGVALGGGVSFLVQRSTQQAVARTERRKLEVARRWVAERTVRVLCPLPVHDAARAYFLVLNGAVWEGLPEGESVRDLLAGPRLAFLDAARVALDGSAA